MNKRLTDVNKKRLIGCVWGTISSLVGLIVISTIVYYVKYNDINWGITLLTLGMTAALGLGAAFVYYRKLLASQIESDYHLSNEEKEKEIAKLGIDRDEIKGIVRAYETIESIPPDKRQLFTKQCNICGWYVHKDDNICGNCGHDFSFKPKPRIKAEVNEEPRKNIGLIIAGAIGSIAVISFLVFFFMIAENKI